MNADRVLWVAVVLWLGATAAVTPQRTSAQDATPGDASLTDAVPAPGEPAAESGLITLNFPDNVPLKAVVAYASTRLRMNILYDEALLEQQVTLKTPTAIPLAALPGVLQTVLHERGLALVDADVPGLKRIVPVANLAQATRLVAPEEHVADSASATQVFVLKHVQPDTLVPAIQPLLTSPGGMATPVPGQPVLIVSDRASTLKRLSELIAAVDTPRAEPAIVVVQLQHSLAAQLLAALQAPLSLQAQQGQANPMVITHDDPSNSLIVAGSRSVVEQAMEAIRSLDVPPVTQRRVYTPKTLAPRWLDKLIQGQFDAEFIQRNYRASPDEVHGLLVITAPANVHAQIEQLLAEVDVAVPTIEQPVRFHKLTNTVAADVLATLRMLEGRPGRGGAVGVSQDTLLLPVGPLSEEARDARHPGDDSSATSADGDEMNGDDDLFGPGALERRKAARRPASAPLPDSATAGAFSAPENDDPDRPIIAADENTNSIIIIAPPQKQELYAQIIKQLDQRRPQVLIEVTIVSLDTSNGFELGVDIGLQEGKVISFSSFGISDLDPATGSLTPINAPGGTFALLSPDVADIVVRALSTNSRARLVSMPRVLVNDNETGKLDSLSKEPFERVVTTDGGTQIIGEGETAEAGTRVEVTPHISAGDYLQLEYAVELSSFVGTRQPNLPPPSQENTVESRVTIPDGHTIVVGGLNRSDSRNSVSSIPLLGDIPLLKYLFRSETRDSTNTTLFVFIRPTILTDPRFNDLKHLSRVDVNAAKIAPDEPPSEPMLLEPDVRVSPSIR